MEFYRHQIIASANPRTNIKQRVNKNTKKPQKFGVSLKFTTKKNQSQAPVLTPDGLGRSQFPSERCRGQEEEGGGKEQAARSRQISARNSKGGMGR